MGLVNSLLLTPRIPRLALRFLALLGIFLGGLSTTHAQTSVSGFRELPLGPARIGFSGGGSAALTGVQALFANPAALQPLARHQAEVSLLDFASFPSLYAGYAARTALESGYALSAFRDGRESGAGGEARQGLLAGLAYGPPDLFSLGVVFVSQSVGKNVGIDFHTGVMLKPLPGWQVNAVWRNVLESGIGHPPHDYPAKRAVQIGTGYAIDPGRWKGRESGNFRGFLMYDLNMDPLPQSRFAHIWALQTEFFPDRSLGLGVSWRIPPEENDSLPRYGASLSMAFPLERHLLVCRYGLSFQENNNRPSQSLALTFDFFRESEPVVSGLAVRLNHPLRVLGEAEKPLYFHLVVEGYREVRDWTLVLAASDEKGRPQETVHSFSGRELPPRSIRWDGKDDQNRDLPVGFYVYRLEASDERGRKSYTRWQMLEVTLLKP